MVTRSTARQPRGFSLFFMTEIWERYSFYIVQTLLILYFIHQMKLSDRESYNILSSFTALAHMNPVLGGYIGDRILGSKTSILAGLCLIILGYIILALELTKLPSIIAALSVIAVGTGLLKPNISSLLGTLYRKNDTRRHAGYVLFYVGIYVGIMLATCFGGYLQHYAGWQKTYFSTAGIICIAWVIFNVGSRYFNIQDTSNILLTLKGKIKSLCLIIVAIIINFYVIGNQVLAISVFSILAIACLFIVIYEIINARESEKRGLITCLVLIGIAIFFWTIYFQLYFSMNLFVDRVVDRDFFGYSMPPSFFLGIEAMGIIICGPLLSYLWQYLAQNNKSPSIIGKCVSGLLVLSIALVMLFVSTFFSNATGQVVSAWIVLVYLIIAIGELMLSPTCLAMVTELAPRRLWGIMMGILFVAIGIGGKLAGVMANYAAIPDNIHNLRHMGLIYRHAFGTYAVTCLAFTVLGFFMIKIIKNNQGINFKFNTVSTCHG